MSFHDARMHVNNALLPYSRAREDIIRDYFKRGFPYSRKLSVHTSCVNALAFSSGDGRWLASGGDDLKIRLWDFHQENIEDSPSMCPHFEGPLGNIFSLAFSATNRYLHSGGTDDRIVKYDLSRAGAQDPSSSIVSVFDQHTDSIRDISCHSVQDEVFMSGSEDGSILLHDCRAESTMTRAQGTLQLEAEVTGVRMHPVMEHIFATSDHRGRLCLRDTRMAFGSRTQRAGSGTVLQYHTLLVRGHKRSNPEVSSIVWDREGQKLAATFLYHTPAIYALSDSQPIATCSGKNLPDGTPAVSGADGNRTYENASTMKHGSFGGPGLDEDQFYSAGSDDFRGYIWRIPSIPFLTGSRDEMDADGWATRILQDKSSIAYTDTSSSSLCVPVELDTPISRLGGHNSIVNSVLIHPHMPHIVTAGVERHIVLHSPTPASPCCSTFSKTPTETRRLPDSNPTDRRHLLRALVSDESGDTEDDVSTIALFDEILRQEGGEDVFELRLYGDSEDGDGDNSVLSEDVF